MFFDVDESDCFFKALPDAGLVQKGKKAKGGKKSKQLFTIAFFVSDAGQKIDEPIVIWKSKLPRCFKGLRDPLRPGNVHYFSNSKSWVILEIFETVLSKLNRKLVYENRKIILFLDNATCHPESMDDKFSNIKIVFLPKNATSRLQPLDAGITLGWRQKARAECIDSVINSVFRQVVISDESEDEVEVNKNKRCPNLKETLEMLDKICQCPPLDEKQVAMLGDVTQELENRRINEKKQTRIEHFFLKNM